MKNKNWLSGCLVLVAAASVVSACKKEEEPVRPHVAAPPPTAAPPPGVEVDSAKIDLYGALPETAASKTNPPSAGKTLLGKMLFFDARLSKGQDVSCNGCHDLGKFGADGQALSTGTLGAKTTRSTPSVYDVALATTQFWDGRSETVEDAVKAMLLSPEAGGGGETETTQMLQSVPGYVDAFKKAFPDDENPVTFANTANALAAFVRTLLTPTKWDEFAKGKKTALTEDEKKGFLKFVEVGCPTCHLGPLVGGTMFQKLGKEKPWPNQKDKGRSLLTKSASDEMMFRVSPLRNVEHTAPYFHDGSAATLEEAVKTMASHQLAKDLSDDDAKSIVTWLRTLSAPSVADFAKAPELPPSGPKTPKPPKAAKH